MGFPGGASGKEPNCQSRRRKRHGFDPWAGRFPGEGHGDPLHCSCLENPMGKGAWQATVHGLQKVRHNRETWECHRKADLVWLPLIVGVMTAHKMQYLFQHPEGKITLPLHTADLFYGEFQSLLFSTVFTNTQQLIIQ